VTQDAPHGSGNDTASLLSGVVAGIGKLVKGELALARAEATAHLRQAAGGLGRLAAAAVIGLVGLQYLAGAAVAGLMAAGLGPVWSPLIAGLVLCAVAAALGYAGRATLVPGEAVPRRSLRNLRRDAAALKTAITPEGVRHV